MGKLAITGGKPVRAKPQERVKWPQHDQAECEALARVANSGRWQQGPEVAEFEEMFAAYQHAKHAICANNGTVTMEIALRAFGVGAGDEVIIPPLTFCATGLCALMVGAIPVFADVERHNSNLCPKAFEASITDRTRAVIPIHYGGTPADMDGIMEVARKHDIRVIEDAAHAHGAEWKGTRVGAIGDIGSFSFQSEKMMVSGDGGIMTTNDDDFAALCKSLRTFGYGYPEPLMTSNWRLSEFQAAVLKVQFTRIDDQIEYRMKNAQIFLDRIEEFDGGITYQMDERVTRLNGYNIPLQYNAPKFKGLPRTKFLEALQAEGYTMHTGYTVPLYKGRLYQEKAFGASWAGDKHGRKIDYTKVCCPVAEKLADEEMLTIGHECNLMGSAEDMNGLVDAIVKIQQNVDEIV
ncbi:MAG: DegT/DnrJ/EryC1/StrS family aminotransferase [Planctomycetota bacterium]|nr:DegT/DnrJ/EryC1/StrS family aminotransferase [Planctomycetota bacterium]